MQTVNTGDESNTFKILSKPVKNNATIKLPGISLVVNYKVTDATGHIILAGAFTESVSIFYFNVQSICGYLFCYGQLNNTEINFIKVKFTEIDKRS